MLEFWEDIAGFEGAYRVSSLGRVHSVSRAVAYKDGRCRMHEGKLITPKTNTNGYLIVRLWANNVSYVRVIHRLVASAFIPNPDDLPEVDHIHGDKKDNRAVSLRWVSKSDNQRNRHTTRTPSGIVGVYYREGFKTPWMASIADASGRQKHLGSFSTKEAAAAVRAKHQEQYAWPK